ncbi:hypothetical protein FQN49_008851 [Arthroderma sp. PD_2]|nr:hypothetical protein FQN49_008851 [Arthroderma sp. PD_2]
MEKREVRYSVEPKTFTCLNTSGQAFAVWLNLVYLLPLTFLFVRFFVRSYLRRTETGARHPTTIHAAEKAGMDAIKGVTREITNAVIEMHGDGAVSELSSGTSTPRNGAAAYEASVVDIMSKKQRQVERRMSQVEKHVERPVTVESQTASGVQTPDVRAYEASVEDVMSKQEREIDSHPEESTAHGVEEDEAGFDQVQHKKKKKSQKKHH